MLIRHGFKTYPWWIKGFGSGSDDALNHAQRAECGLDDQDLSYNPACYLDDASKCEAA